MENIVKIDVAKFSSWCKEFCRVKMLQKFRKRADCYASLLARGQQESVHTHTGAQAIKAKNKFDESELRENCTTVYTYIHHA